MHEYMKTITLTDVAYQRLKDWKQGSQSSFSSVVLKVVPERGTLGQMIEDVKLSIKNPDIVDFYGRSGGMLPEVDEIKKRIKAYGN